MALEELGKPRFQKQEIASGVIYSIPSKKNWFMILFIGFWLLGWAVGEFAVIGILIAGIFKAFAHGISDAVTAGTGAFSGLFLIAWLGAWTVGGAVAIYSWLWQVKGMEIITISYDRFKIQKKVPIWTRTKEYRLKDVASLRVSNVQSSLWSMSGSMEFWGMSGGRLAFDYGAKTVQFGIGIDEAEAKLLIKDIEKKYPKIIEDIIQ
jgi:hypothetical protein